MIRKLNTYSKPIAVYILLNIAAELFAPGLVFALTSGPHSPEFASFEPVGTTDMVDEFSGEFTYNLPVLNVPGPDGSGYALSLSYHSGVSSEEEASWVGFGWSLNPGAVNRMKRGYADDYKGADVKHYNKTRPNWTVAATTRLGFEIKANSKADTDANTESAEAEQSEEEASKGNDDIVETESGGEPAPETAEPPQNPESGGASIGIDLSKTVRFNNYKGFSKSMTFGASYNGLGGALSSSGGNLTYENRINPFAILSNAIQQKFLTDAKSKFEEGVVDDFMRNNEKSIRSIKEKSFSLAGYQLSDFYTQPSAPFSISAYKGVSYNRSGSLQLNFFTNLGIEVGERANFNIQFPVRKQDVTAYGYMYNPDRDAYGEDANKSLFKSIIKGSENNFNKAIGSDYQVERGGDINKRDRYLPVPYSTPDIFQISGEGMGGGFRVYREDIGHYYPNNALSYEKIKPMGFELGVGPNSATLGLEVGKGFHYTAMSDWDKPNGKNDGLVFRNSDEKDDKSRPGYFQFNKESDGYFRFMHDMGGSINVTGTNNVHTASLTRGNEVNVPGVKRFYPDLSKIGISSNNMRQADKSSFIRSILYKEFKAGNGIDKEANVNADFTETVTDNLVAQFAVKDAGGSIKVFGQPVFTKDELNLNLSYTGGGTIDNNYLWYPDSKVFAAGSDDAAAGVTDKVLDNKFVNGQFSKTPYTTAHLITQILTADYIDVDNNFKADDKDLGGWTKFGYRQWKDATGNKWYRYRTPYNGLLYNQGTILNKYDNSGSISSGQKEIYYLKKIETRTHIAFFVTNKSLPSDFTELSSPDLKIQKILTGSQLSREDGLGASRLESDQSDPAVKKGNKDPNQQLERLERIVLFAKSDFSKPVQVTNFAYEEPDKSLCKGAPNTLNGQGKLTLKKVWFDNEGAYGSRIAPYQFEYSYPQPYPVSGYDEINSFLTSMKLKDVENPDYSVYLLDNWGNFQSREKEKRFDSLKTWVYQGNKYENAFDPAAWNLKRIILPSGGEIHVQYEQKDYLYVQDKTAMAMVSLRSESQDGYKDEETKYYLNMNDLDLGKNVEVGDLNEYMTAYAGKIKDFYTNSKGPVNFIYFKFLYDLEGNSAGLNDCSSEYISGYASVTDVGYDAAKKSIWISLGERQDWTRKNKMRKVKKTVPRHICYDYFVTNADGLAIGENCKTDLHKFTEFENNIFSIYDGGTEDELHKAILTNESKGSKKIKQDVAVPAMWQAVGSIAKVTPTREQKCKSVNYPLSYLKIPMFEGKKGGGIRVKRLLMYDGGMETGDEVLYGTEYKYELEDGTTSGVAANEPNSSKDDHSLVSILDRTHQNWLSRVIAGPDKEYNEGPLGESILPSPSVGHSRVVVENIHKGKTGSGHKINEYYTCRDYPVKYEKTNLADKWEDQDVRKKDWMVLPIPMFGYSARRTWITQGYTFVLNQMHGQPKLFATYAGDYQRRPGDYTDKKFYNESAAIASTSYEYFAPGEAVWVVNYNEDKKELTPSKRALGREEELTMEMRSTTDEMLDLQLEIDLSFQWAPWLSVEPNLGIRMSYNLNEFSSHVTCKVVSSPVIVKAVEKKVNGIKVREENIAFSEMTGQPLITKVTDGYNGNNLEAKGTVHEGVYYSYKFPAAWIYAGMGRFKEDGTGKSDEEKFNYKNQLAAMVAEITAYGTDGNWLGKDIKENVPVDISKPKGVVSASATTLANDWFLDKVESEGGKTSDEKSGLVMEYLAAGGNTITKDSDQFKSILNKLNASYKPEATYTYNTGRTVAAATDKKIYREGIMTDFVMFDWNSTLPSDSKWLMTNKVVKYSPDGNPLEETNALGISSAARFGYKNLMMPVMVAANAKRENIWFQDFENETDARTSRKDAHSGSKYLDITSNKERKLLDESKGVILSGNMMSKGATAKIWIRSEMPTAIAENPDPSPAIMVNNSLAIPLVKVGSSGEWTLWEGKVTSWPTMVSGQKLYLNLKYNYASGETVMIDDFRFQPLDAEATCYVYDPATLRLLTQFDDRHFGLFYQYDNEGKLISQIVETERGNKTIKETQYNVPLRNR